MRFSAWNPVSCQQPRSEEDARSEHTYGGPAGPPLLYFAAVLPVRPVRIWLLTSGAKRARTADLLHAIWRQHVHPRPSPQVTVLTRPRESPRVRVSCCTSVLYRNPASTSVSNATSSAGPAGGTRFTQVPHDRQAHQGLLAFTDPARSSPEATDPQKSRIHFRRPGQPGRRKNPLVQRLESLKGPQGTLGIFIRINPPVLPGPIGRARGYLVRLNRSGG